MQHEVVHRFDQGELYGGAWATFNVSRAWSIVVRYVCEAFSAHPWAWNEIGFGGPAYPRGYLNLGVEKLEHWEEHEQTQ